MQSLCVRIWRFRVRPDKTADFLEAYGAHGAWARLFHRARGYRGSELLRSTDEHTYVTIDRWESAGDWEAFLETWREEYVALDRACEVLTESEEDLGTFLLPFG